MPALYLPVIIMLLALVFRGVAFEFRWVAKPSHTLWDRSFIGGISITAAFMQGVILGGLLQGIAVRARAFPAARSTGCRRSRSSPGSRRSRPMLCSAPRGWS